MTSPIPAHSSRLRLSILLIVVGCLFVALVARLWFLQVVSASAADQQVQQAEYVQVYVPAPRGEILDRNGKVLVGNRQVPEVEVQRQEASDAAVVSRLAALLGTSTKAMRAAIDNDQYSSLSPVPVASATAAQILYVDEHQSLFPGVTATTVNEPYATQLGIDAGDVVGYVGQVDGADLSQLRKQYPGQHYEAGDIVGQTGIEAEYQPYLNGTPGVEDFEVNAKGQVLRRAKYIPPVPGDNVALTLNAEVQKVADEAVVQGQTVARSQPADTGAGNYTSPGGSAVVEDPRNGQVLALASEPYLNVEQFDRGITPAEYKADDNLPNDELNLAIQGVYAPGSTFKLVTATAGLADGVVSPGYIFNDTAGEITIDGQVFHDDGGVGSGYIDLSTALTVSSDNYFNFVGLQLWNDRARLGDVALQKVATSYGLDSPTGIDLPGGNANAGTIPTPATIEAEHKSDPKAEPYGIWFPGYSAEMAIGQFQDLVSPLQLADAYATFANGGTLYKPQIVLRITSPSGKVIKSFASTVKGHSQHLSSADRQAMIQGYVGVTHDQSGTGYPVFANSSLDGEDIAGKTGTAQVQAGQDTSVFTSFAPATDSKYVVDCFMEDSGYGESIAAPIVREMFHDEIFHKPLNPVDFQPVTGSAD